MKAVPCASRGSRRKAASPSGPIFPAPRCSCRSLRLPSAERESFRCTSASRSRPIRASNRSSSSAAASASRCRGRRPTGAPYPGRRQAGRSETVHALQDLRQVLDPGAQVVAAARRVLEHQHDVRRRLGQDGIDVVGDAADARLVTAATVRADVGVHVPRAERRGTLHLEQQTLAALRGERLGAAGEVDQVAGVDGDGRDVMGRQVGDELRRASRRLGTAPPGRGVVAEDLQRRGADLPRPSGGLHQPGRHPKVDPDAGSAVWPGEPPAGLRAGGSSLQGPNRSSRRPLTRRSWDPCCPASTALPMR